MPFQIHRETEPKMVVTVLKLKQTHSCFRKNVLYFTRWLRCKKCLKREKKRSKMHTTVTFIFYILFLNFVFYGRNKATAQNRIFLWNTNCSRFSRSIGDPQTVVLKFVDQRYSRSVRKGLVQYFYFYETTLFTASHPVSKYVKIVNFLVLLLFLLFFLRYLN